MNDRLTEPAPEVLRIPANASADEAAEAIRTGVSPTLPPETAGDHSSDLLND